MNASSTGQLADLKRAERYHRENRIWKDKRKFLEPGTQFNELGRHTSTHTPQHTPGPVHRFVTIPERRSAGAFNEAGRAHPAADAHRDDGVAALPALQLVQGGGDLAGARRAERVPERDRAAVHVHALGRQAQLALAVERLRRERLVDLEQVDLIDLEAGL